LKLNLNRGRLWRLDTTRFSPPAREERQLRLFG